MNGEIAQLVALACFLNGRVQGKPASFSLASNSTCNFCKYVRFERHHAGWFRSSWKIAAATPEEWLAHEAGHGRNAWLLHEPTYGPHPDWKSAGFVGGGGRWFLVTTLGESSDLWQADWKVGDRDADEDRLWQVRYGAIAEDHYVEPPDYPSLDVCRGELHAVLVDAIQFGERNSLGIFADCFRKALVCLEASDPFASVPQQDLAPREFLSPIAAQLLAACQPAWVFGGMGSWNDVWVGENDEPEYERISQRLFEILNLAIAVATYSTFAPLGRRD